MLVRIGNGVRMVDRCMSEVLFPIVAISVHHPARIKSTECGMRQEEGTSERSAYRQDVTIIAVAVAQGSISGPAMMKHAVVNCVFSCSGRQNVSKQTLVPTRDRKRHLPLMLWAPMPRERPGWLGRVPTPLHLIDQFLDQCSEQTLVWRLAFEILASANQALQQKGGLYKIAAIVAT
jgi:hypothetical protein